MCCVSNLIRCVKRSQRKLRPPFSQHAFSIQSQRRIYYNGYISLYIEAGSNMNLQITKWGNSLAVRIPAEYVRRIGIKEGDSVEASLTVDGGISIRPSRWDRKAFAQELQALRQAMPMGESVIDELRREARY